MSADPSDGRASTSLLLVDDEESTLLGPLTRLRPAFELRLGVFSLRERAERTGASIRARVRGPHQECLAESLPDLASSAPGEGRVLAVRSRCTATVAELTSLLDRASREDFVLGRDGEWVALSSDASSVDAALTEPVPTADSPVGVARRPWEIVREVGTQIDADFAAIADAVGDVGSAWRTFGVEFDEGAWPDFAFARPFASGRSRMEPGVHLLEPDRILLGEGVVLEPGVVLDARGGAIVLGAGCRVGANSVVVGPTTVGPLSTVNPLTRLREASAIGAICKVGGEIEDSIVLDGSNKQHDGFLGHAYVASWANLGADTTVSDLKNNYGNVRVDLGEGVVDSGERFVGPTIGDHCKTAIGTLLGTGTVLDVGANVFGSGFPPRYVPPFAWGGFDDARTEPDRAMATARTVLGRRGARLRPAAERLLASLAAPT